MTTVVLARSARQALSRLDYLLADAVLDALTVLEREPEVGYPLRGRLTGLWSYRVGVYRIVYEHRDRDTVRVVAIRHRGEAYGKDPDDLDVDRARSATLTTRRWPRPSATWSPQSAITIGRPSPNRRWSSSDDPARKSRQALRALGIRGYLNLATRRAPSGIGRCRGWCRGRAVVPVVTVIGKTLGGLGVVLSDWWHRYKFRGADRESSPAASAITRSNVWS